MADSILKGKQKMQEMDQSESGGSQHLAWEAGQAFGVGVGER